MAERCHLCKIELDQPGKPETLDCGGDCLRCMAEVAEDPDCIAALNSISATAELHNTNT